MRWLDTDFGRYVLCPAAAVRNWQGTEVDAIISQEIASVLVPGVGHVISLGGEPMPVAYFPESGTIVRWYFGESDEDVVEAVRLALLREDWVAGAKIRVAGEMTLFDSASRGYDISPHECLQVHLEDGDYEVLSVETDYEETTSLRLDRLVRAHLPKC
ncbi:MULTISPECIES: Imm21 family immunity protein [unclassified Streptomyces]|uniref:Imm21 family immunity protein n=1 Tax=unclassified Streptomyces TaxID=2593676 RepID=UPI002E2AF0D0|nr:Imm21 family immunity protein [Streptomyces sp. NBC_00223]